jgi:hypothetical protein
MFYISSLFPQTFNLKNIKWYKKMIREAIVELVHLNRKTKSGLIF